MDPKKGKKKKNVPNQTLMQCFLITSAVSHIPRLDMLNATNKSALEHEKQHWFWWRH